MKELVADGGIGAHDEGEAALWADEAGGALEKVTAQGVNLLKDPSRRSLLGRIAMGGGLGLHLQLTGEVVSEDGGAEVELITDASAHGDVVHLALALQLGEDRFLSAAAVVEGENLLGPGALVGDDHLEVEAAERGDEQIELHRLLVADLDLVADEEEAEASLPALGLPRGLDESEVGAAAPPAQRASFDHGLELDKALERNRDREVDGGLIESGDDLIAEEGAVHAQLDPHSGKRLAHRADAGQDEGTGADGIVDVARAMEEVEYLAGLSDGAEQRIVGAIALALLVEPDGGAFSGAAGGLDRAVEVQRDSPEARQAQSIEDQGAKEAAAFVRAVGVGTGERAADGGDIGETGQTQQPSDHWIVFVEAQFPKSAVAEQEVDDEEQHHGVVAEDRAHLQVAETGSQPFLDVELGEEGLEDDQARERCECLVFETDLGESVKLAMDGGSARLHVGGLL